MQCEICKKNEATIHLTEIVDGVRSEIHLCEQCAREQGIAVQSQMPINELLSGLLASQPSEEEMAYMSENQKACPHCGFTLDEFRKNALLGCPHDYEVFEDALENLIKKAQNGHTQHCGKIPANTPGESKKKMKIRNLQKRLESVVQQEKYEQAAKLRDEIEQLKD